MKFKQLLSVTLFMIFTTSVVNTHALSHLFENDFSSIEHCSTCDEYVLSTKDDLQFYSPQIQTQEFTLNEIIVEPSVSIYNQVAVKIHPLGKYYNKPPPHKLV